MAGDRLMTAFRATVSVPKLCLPETRLLFSCYSWQGLEWQAINGCNLLLPAHNHDKKSTVVCVFSKVNAGSSLSAILSLWTVSESALFVSAYCCRQERTSMPKTMMAGHHCMLLFTGVRRTRARPLSTTYVTWTWKTMQYVPLFVKTWVCRFPARGKKMHAGSGIWKLKQIRGFFFLLTASAGLILGIRHVKLYVNLHENVSCTEHNTQVNFCKKLIVWKYVKV